MKKVLILGRGPSLDTFKSLNIEDIDDVILMNNHEKTLQNKESFDKLKDKNIYVMCNINQAGFVPGVLDKINVKACLTNRLSPDWELWQKHKDAQQKHSEGGTLNNVGYLPYIAEDEPYLYVWRGPKGKNNMVMKTYNGRIIEHMPEEAEQYVIPVYKDKLVCNCSFYGTLYAILKLQAQHVIYCGLDFYDNLKIQKKWFVESPKYLSSEWWDLRVKYEGEHMKVLWDKYMSSFFPDNVFEFYTTANLNLKSENILYNKVETEQSNKTYY
tara:strand:+ start:5010 stop:5819 length:810 start_codon:yes stop_codon:yes gene_type:complete